jgi:hypothetical protein
VLFFILRNLQAFFPRFTRTIPFLNNKVLRSIYIYLEVSVFLAFHPRKFATTILHFLLEDVLEGVGILPSVHSGSVPQSLTLGVLCGRSPLSRRLQMFAGFGKTTSFPPAYTHFQTVGQSYNKIFRAQRPQIMLL